MPNGFHILAVFVFFFTAFSSEQDEITKHKSELQSIRRQIQEYEQKITQQQSKEKSTLELLDSYDRKATLVRRLITRLRVQEAELQDTIGRTRFELQQLDGQLKYLKHHYASYVKSVYKSGRVYDIELLLSSKSINQLYIRSYYLRRFTDQRRRDAEKIDTKKGEVEQVQYRLQSQLAEERRLIAEKVRKIIVSRRLRLTANRFLPRYEKTRSRCSGKLSARRKRRRRWRTLSRA